MGNIRFSKGGEQRCCLGCGRETASKSGYCWKCLGMTQPPMSRVEPKLPTDYDGLDMGPAEDEFYDRPRSQRDYEGGPFGEHEVDEDDEYDE